MYNPMSSMIRHAKRSPNDKLNILTFVSHERYEPTLALTGHNFFSIITEGTKTWKTEYSPVPDNYTIFQDSVPDFILNDVDLILSHNPFVHIPLAHKMGLHVPLLNIFHTMPPPGWNSENIPQQYRQMFDRCDHHVYISDFNKLSWGYNRGDVILHGIDTKLFTPPTCGCDEWGHSYGCSGNPDREAKILTVANDYINRDWCLGFSIWKELAQNLPMHPVGDTPGLSKPTKDLAEMIQVYQKSLIFLNTSTASPVPMSLLEAMACGCACVSAATCLIPDVIEHGVDGFLCSPSKPEQFKKYCQQLLNDKDMAIQMGQKARKKIQTMFSLDNFIENWNSMFRKVLWQ